MKRKDMWIPLLIALLAYTLGIIFIAMGLSPIFDTMIKLLKYYPHNAILVVVGFICIFAVPLIIFEK